VKNFKYSFINKTICALLCLVTILSAAGITSFGIASLAYCHDGIPESWTESYDFTNYFSGAVGSIFESVAAPSRENDLKKELRAQKKSIVAKALKQYHSQYQSLKKEAADAGYDDFKSYIDEYYDSELNVNVEISFGSYEFLSHPFSNTDMKNAEKYFSNEYDKFVDSQLPPNYFEFYSRDYNRLPDFYAECGSRVITSADTEDLVKEEFTNNSVYFIWDNGEISYKGISKQLADSVYKNYIKNDKYAKNTVLYTCIKDDYDASPAVLLNNGGNLFNDLRQFHENGVNFYNHIVSWAVFDLILIVISFICAFYFFSITGRKSENGEVKLIITDKIPFELHLGAYIGLGVGAVAAYISMTEYMAGYFYSALFVPATVVLALAMWLMLFEFSTSVARYAKSDKKLYENFLIFLLLKLLFIIAKALIKLDIKIFKRLKNRFSKAKKHAKESISILTYRPSKFDKNVTMLFILYCFINLIIILFIALCLASNLPFFASLLLLGDVAGNFVIIKKVLDYIKKLDIIIAASEKHEDVNLDIDSLPKSLEILAQSMKYTNAELRDAVNQAVKDERLRTELITNVSHDLKTPLTSIITYVDLLSKCDIQDEKAKEYIGVLDEKGARLKRLIDDLVEASKVTSGNIKFNPVQLNLSELCLQSTVEVQSDFEKAGLDLIIKQGETSPIIFADGPKTFRIIENLLSNARKYSAKGSRVYAGVYKEGKYGIFELKNISAQPLDISPDELTERFVRGDKSRNLEGNGLGLSIAKELCRAQKGELEILIDGDLFKARVKLPLA